MPCTVILYLGIGPSIMLLMDLALYARPFTLTWPRFATSATAAVPPVDHAAAGRARYRVFLTGTSKLYLSLGFLSVLLFAADAALAHRPYTTQVRKVALPEGQLGEVRLLHGDGIFRLTRFECW